MQEVLVPHMCRGRGPQREVALPAVFPERFGAVDAPDKSVGVEVPNEHGGICAAYHRTALSGEDEKPSPAWRGRGGLCPGTKARPITFRRGNRSRGRVATG